LFEVATDASDTRLADRRLKSLRSSVNGALGFAPTDGFLWFIAYWSAINQGDAVSDHLEELRRSYAARSLRWLDCPSKSLRAGGL
jgi:hypothetical protein